VEHHTRTGVTRTGIPNSTLTTYLILRIFPHGDDPFPKDVIIGIEGQRGGRFEIVENSPKVFNRVKGSAVGEIVFPLLFGVGESWIVKPHGPFGIQIIRATLEESTGFGWFSCSGHGDECYINERANLK